MLGVFLLLLQLLFLGNSNILKCVDRGIVLFKIHPPPHPQLCVDIMAFWFSVLLLKCAHVLVLRWCE